QPMIGGIGVLCLTGSTSDTVNRILRQKNRQSAAADSIPNILCAIETQNSGAAHDRRHRSFVSYRFDQRYGKNRIFKKIIDSLHN
ncbi:MAG: hypothetical protein ACI3V2_05020, partial [Faecousia sp.]